MFHFHKLSKSNRKKVLYVVNGGVSFSVEFILFVTLYWLLPIAVVAQSFSYLISLSVNFYGSRKFTFASERAYLKGARRQLIQFGLLAAFNLVVTNVVIALLIDQLAILPELAKLITMVMVICWNFIIFDKIIFRTPR